MEKYSKSILSGLLSFRVSSYTLGLLIFLCFFLRPYPEAYIGGTAMRVIDMLVLGSVIFYFLVANIKMVVDKNIFIIIVIYLAMFTSGLLSLTNGFIQGVTSFNYRDPLDIIRYLQFPVFLLFGYFLAKERGHLCKDFIACVFIIFIIVFIFAILQRFFSTQVQFLTNLYSPDHQARRVINTNRVTTLFGNPNTCALMICLLCSFFFAMVVPKKPHAKKRMIWIFIFLSLVTVLLTGSRTGLIVFGFLVLTYLYTKLKRKIIFFLLFPIFFGLIILLRDQILEVIRYFNNYLYLGIKLVLTMDTETLLSEGNSFFSRFGRWNQALALFSESPLFGLGPMRGVVTSSTDNYYIYLLARYGIVGLVLYLSFIVYSFYLAMKARKKSGYVQIFGYAFIFQTAVILFMNFLIEAQIINSAAYMHLTTIGVLIAILNQDEANKKGENSTFN